MPEESTTPDREELVRRGIEASNRRDIDAAMALYAPNAVWETVAVLHGPEAIRGFIEDWIGSYEDFEQALEEFSDYSDGVTLAVVRARGRLPDSSGVIEIRYAAVATWRDGLIERIATTTDIYEARAAAERLAEERR
jgi:ketosteroid isomerase-like protein